MSKTALKLDYILNMANNVEFDNTDIYISRLLFEYYDDIPNYTLDKMIDCLKVTKSRLKKYIINLGCNNYTDLKDEIIFEQIVRKNQIKHRYQNFDKQLLIKSINILRKEAIDLEIIDNICQLIHCSNRIIFYGSPTLLNLLFDFQVDMRIFNKVVLTSSVNNNKILVPKDGDLVCICTATGRLFGCCDSQFEECVLKNNNKKILFTKNYDSDNDVDYVLAMSTRNDYYEMHYVYMFYLDLIKTRYYELYVKDDIDDFR